MLQFRQIVIDGMGPYRQPATLTFPEDGVTIVFGENGHGKTSLLNAFRYVFFGKVIGRGDRRLPLQELSNWENAAAGKCGFTVILRFAFGASEYELTRTCSPRPYIAKPATDADYVQEHFLRRDGQVLSPAERDSELSRIMPDEVSRFFLFDGELLQQYEELLRKESDMGRDIAAAIERILGLPVLTNNRAILAQLRENAVRTEAQAAKKNHQTQQFGMALANLAAQTEMLEKDLVRLKNELAEWKEKKATAEELLSQHQVALRLLDERDKLRKDITDLEQKLPEKQAKLREMLKEAWRWLLGSKAGEERERLQTEIDSLQQKATQKALTHAIVKDLQAALQQGACGTCLRPLDAGTAAEIEQRIASMGTVFEAEDEERLNQLRMESARLKTLEVADQTYGLLEVSDSIGDIEAQLALKRDRIDEIEGEDIAKHVDEASLRKAKSEFEQAVLQTRLLENGLKVTREKLEKLDKDTQDVQRKLSASPGGSALEQERRRREVYSQLHDLFDKGVSDYRDRLRTRVEKDATELFLQLTSDKGYKGLSINENYGLTIVHQNGQNIVVRSAGYEHVVALALMGALQKNAPLRGPIIMDSTFTRLDQTHSTNVLKALPSMARQTMLLVFRREVDPQLARNELLGRLKAEYRLQRISSFETQIVKQ